MKFLENLRCFLGMGALGKFGYEFGKTPLCSHEVLSFKMNCAQFIPCIFSDHISFIVGEKVFQRG